MADVSYDFTGTNGDPWSSTYWDADYAWSNPTSPITAITSIQGNKGRIAVGSAYSDRLTRLKSGAGTFGRGDGTWTVTVVPSAWGVYEARFDFMIRQSAGWGALDYYRLRLEMDSTNKGRCGLFRADGTQLGSYFNVDVSTDPTAVYLKLQADGSALKAKAWSNNESEPGSWDVEATDATWPNTNEHCSFSYWTGASSSLTVDIDSIEWSAIATGYQSEVSGTAITGADVQEATLAARKWFDPLLDAFGWNIDTMIPPASAGSAQTVVAQPAELVLTAVPGALSTGGTTVTAQVATLALTAVPGARSTGGVTVTAQPATLALTAVQGAVAVGGITVTAQPAALTLTAVSGTVTTGGITVAAQVATLTLAAVPGVASISGGSAQTVVAQPAELVLSAVPGTLSVGGVTVTAQAATLALVAVPGTLGVGGVQVTAQPATLTLVAVPGARTFGGTTVTAQPATLALTAVPGVVSIGGIVVAAQLAVLVLEAVAGLTYLGQPELVVGRIVVGRDPGPTRGHEPRPIIGRDRTRASGHEPAPVIGRDRPPLRGRP